VVLFGTFQCHESCQEDILLLSSWNEEVQWSLSVMRSFMYLAWEDTKERRLQFCQTASNPSSCHNTTQSCKDTFTSGLQHACQTWCQAESEWVTGGRGQREA
jgi:hypothetical protein